jgi:hypothetical protein
MANDRTQRRQIREKIVIDHLANEVFDPATTGGPAVQDSKTSTGLPVEKQVRKEWNPKKGGLPTFFTTRK